MPYLPIDPAHVGRTYQDVIRVNSQSGKGGVSYILKNFYGLDLPRRLQIEFTRVIQSITDVSGMEIKPAEIWTAFEQTYLETTKPLEIVSHRVSYDSDESDETDLAATIRFHGEEREIKGSGNGPIAAFKVAVADACGLDAKLVDYHEDSIGAGADAQAAAYVEVTTPDHVVRWGVGIHANIVSAGLEAFVSAINHIGDDAFATT